MIKSATDDKMEAGVGKLGLQTNVGGNYSHKWAQPPSHCDAWPAHANLAHCSALEPLESDSASESMEVILWYPCRPLLVQEFLILLQTDMQIRTMCFLNDNTTS